MSATQPPLPFMGDPERSCPWCGMEEANSFVMGINHWPDSTWAKREGRCPQQSAEALRRQQEPA